MSKLEGLKNKYIGMNLRVGDTPAKVLDVWKPEGGRTIYVEIEDKFGVSGMKLKDFERTLEIYN